MNECIDALLEGESLEQCLGRYPKHAERLEPLLRAVIDARETSLTLEPPPELKVRVGNQVRARLDAKRQRARANRLSFFDWMPQWATMTVIAVLTVIFCSGCVFAASSESVPGDTLYPVKLAFEQVQLAFTFSDTGKADLHAELASRRITEMERMAPKIDPESVEVLTSDLKEHLQEVEELVVVIGRGEEVDEEDGNLEKLEQTLRNNYFEDTDLTVSAEAKAPTYTKDDIADARVEMWTSYKAVFNTIDIQLSSRRPVTATPTPTVTINASLNATVTPTATVNSSGNTSPP